MPWESVLFLAWMGAADGLALLALGVPICLWEKKTKRAKTFGLVGFLLMIPYPICFVITLFLPAAEAPTLIPY